MKKILATLLVLGSFSTLASVKYNCSITNYTSIYDTDNFVNNVVVTLDDKASTAIFPISKRRVAISLKTAHTHKNEINQYGKYQLLTIITEDKEDLGPDEVYVMAGAGFTKLEKAIQFFTMTSYTGKSNEANIGVHCTRI